MNVKNFSSSFFWSCTSATPGMPWNELATTSNLLGVIEVDAVRVGEVGLACPRQRGVLVGLLEPVEGLVARLVEDLGDGRLQRSSCGPDRVALGSVVGSPAQLV